MKRTYFNIGVVVVATLSLVMSACDGITDINDNPNAPTDATTPYLLTDAQMALADNYWGDFTAGRFGLVYAQFWSQNQYTSEDRYDFPNARASSVNNMWGNYYLILNNLEQIKRLNREDPNAYSLYGDNDNQIAIAQILQAWIFHTMTDIWGPIPFHDALGGASNPSPEYTEQRDVYMSLLDSLTVANDRINLGAPGITSGDIIYDGDMTQWKRFANSLKMRIAIRMADVEPGAAAEAIQEALAAGVFESNADNALLSYLSEAPHQNPIFLNYLGGRDDWHASEALIDLMNEHEDPRRSAYAEETANGDYAGFPYGLNEGNAQALYGAEDDQYSRPSAEVISATSPAILMLYDEVLFIQAEAAQRGFIAGDAEALFYDAVEASLNFWGVDDQQEVDAFLDGLTYDAANWRQSLGEQKWLALYMQGVHGWAEWRRLDFEGVLRAPADGPIPDFGRDIAIRLTYPLNERNLNEENLEQAIQMLGGPDTQGTPVWWDVN